MINNPLLHRYVTEKSESAFSELVRQHIDLVYSAALRQVNGDLATAQDVTQTVFIDLARKAPRLIRHPSLTGWLYTSTRYVSAKVRRSEQRRLAREQEACAMNKVLQVPESDPAWENLRPVLDEAMHELTDTDREALLLRYFERRSTSEIGARLGLAEDTARKRVARALEKLRERLAKRGITSTVAALSVALAERTVTAAPTELTGRVSKAAVSMGMAGSGAIGLLWKLLAAAGAVAAICAVTFLPKMVRQDKTIAVSVPHQAIVQSVAVSAAPQPPVTIPTAIDPAHKLVLHIVTADSGRPIPSVTLDFWLYTTNNVFHMKPLVASVRGQCEVPVDREATTQLILISQREGFTDTRLQWHVSGSESIPRDYTLRLARAVTIGGTVVDADGNPVEGAKIEFGNDPDPSANAMTETSNFGWPFHITTTSDSHGHWETCRIAPATLRFVSGAATHRLHLRSEFEAGNAETQKQLLAGTYQFRLGRGVEVRGGVFDTNGNPIAKAKVTVGEIGDVGSRTTRTGQDGHFHVAGCVPESRLLSAEAKGFAPTTEQVDLSSNTGTYTLILRTGKVLRVRVVDPAGLPVRDAQVALNTFRSVDRTPIQTEFSGMTGPDGCFEWDSAPDGELTIDCSAMGHIGSSKTITADGEEHLITLRDPLAISGTVRDATTGNLIPAFRVVAGWPVTNPVTGVVTATWSPLSQDWLNFTGGKFRHVWTKPVLEGTPNPGYVFKIEADGYATFVTRPVALNEGDVQLDASLQPAAANTITVNLANGRPAANVDVGIVEPGVRLALVPGGFSHFNRQSGGSVLSTDSQGKFTLKPDASVTRVIVAGADGYAEATPAALALEPVMMLQPWGRLEGNVTTEAGAGTNCTLAFQIDDSTDQGVSADFMAYQVKTDSRGHFAFAQVPPGKHKLAQLIQIKATPSPLGVALTDCPLTNVVILPGQTTIANVMCIGHFDFK